MIEDIERRIAYAEEAIPRWHSGLAHWRQMGEYRGKPVDTAWLRREEVALNELIREYRLWLRAREKMQHELQEQST